MDSHGVVVISETDSGRNPLQLTGEDGAGEGVWAPGNHAAGPLMSKSCFSGFEVSRA
jgi:hypothetical protein